MTIYFMIYTYLEYCEIEQRWSRKSRQKFYIIPIVVSTWDSLFIYINPVNSLFTKIHFQSHRLLQTYCNNSMSLTTIQKRSFYLWSSTSVWPKQIPDQNIQNYLQLIHIQISYYYQHLPPTFNSRAVIHSNVSIWIYQ